MNRLAIRQHAGLGKLVDGVEDDLNGEEQQKESSDLKKSFDVDAMTVVRPRP